jgi:methylthioribose-1-phosphate isomerase
MPVAQGAFMSRVRPFRYDRKAGVFHLLDQRRLPLEERWVQAHSAADAADAIRSMVVRGAPAIGVTAAYGMVLAHRRGEDLAAADHALRSSRPTAVNLFHALDAVRPFWGDLDGVSKAAERIWSEVELTERAIGLHGATVLRGSVLTHCNTGPLATGGYGTALGAIVEAHRQGRLQHVWVDETRPYMQGTRLTTWELARFGVPYTLITDSMAAWMMVQGRVDAVILGADRMAMNGDFANKIGSYGLAVLARHHGVPFYAALPTSTVDRELATGADIPIEQRDGDELRMIRGQRLTPDDVPVANPAFDLTPHHLLTGIVTEKGLLYPPFDEALRDAV